MLPLLIGAALGLAKSELVDRPKEAKQRRLASETQRLSPWTGLHADAIQQADPFGSALSFGLAGNQIGAGMTAQDLNNQMSKKYLDSQIAQPATNLQPTDMPSSYSFNSQTPQSRWRLLSYND